MDVENAFLQGTTTPKRVLRCVTKTMDYYILYKSDTPIQLKGYTNANCAVYRAYRQSTLGFVISLESGANFWSSEKQPAITLSSTKVEYKVAVVAACEAVWLKRIMKDLGIPIKDPILLYCYNMSNTHLARNPVFHAQIKHIEVHYHFIQERVMAGDIDLQHISTKLLTIDIFTKALGVDTLQQFAKNLGLSITNQPLPG